MRVRFNRWYNALLSALLTLLGVPSCGDKDDDNSVEYGVPSIAFKIDGYVYDESGNALEGIKVYSDGDPYSTKAEAVSTKDGWFDLPLFGGTGFYNETIVAEDVDGELNGGSFQSDTMRLAKLNLKQLEKGDHWYLGKYGDTVTFKLKKKENNDETN